MCNSILFFVLIGLIVGVFWLQVAYTVQLSQLGLRSAVADKTLGATGRALYSLARNGVRNYVVGSVVSNPFEAISKIPGIVQGVVVIGAGAMQKGYQFYQWLEERNERSRLKAIGSECFGESLGELGAHPQGLHQPRQESAPDERGEPARPHARGRGADAL